MSESLNVLDDPQAGDESRPFNLVLVGLMGAGKTTVGRALARKTGWRFFDTDHEIERRTGVRIPMIFDIEGEAGFRQRERRILGELLAGKGRIIATGGGAVLDPENRALIKQRAKVCYLKVSPATMYARTRHDKNRPLLQVADPLAVLTELLAAREQYYVELADITCDGDLHDTARVTELLAQDPIFQCKQST